MAILTDPPEWEVPGTKPPRNIIEVVGWEVGSRPPAPWWNWFFYTVAKSLRELETATLARIINEAGVPGIMAGEEGERPNATPETIGRIYIATDTKRMFRDRGDGWELLNAPDAIGAETPAGAQAKADAAAGAALSAAKAYADEAVAAHAGRTDNPHQVTAAQVGAPTQAAFDAHVADTNNPHQVTAAQLGLGDVLTNQAQILGSRIVDHNLDVPNPPNGWYVRWGNGLQVCFRAWDPWDLDDLSEMRSTTWTFPAAFSSAPFAVLATPAPAPVDQTRMIVDVSRRRSRTATSVGVFARAIEPMTMSTPTVEMVAIGVWS